ncbi:MAG: hypothetical protein HC884_03125 [Chloroflexaceae bacterium]|nr:hypothetical protein [Chloroflexaceae bacterium]
MLVSGSCAGLSILSKSPALALLPVVAVLAFARHHPLRPLAVWGTACAVTIALVWPAVWADPVQVYRLLRTGVEAEGANPHMTGNFFLGQEDPAPGPLFYPVALALRTTPWTLAGLLLLPLICRGRGVGGRGGRAGGRSMATLAGFIILFVLAMSLFPKKFDRYLVPVFPAVDILAAAGLTGVWNRARDAAMRGVATVVLVAVVVAALLNVVCFHPYSIAYFNQALGGTQVGARTFSMGWGEGFDQVAAWLNRQPDITGVLTAAIMIPTLNPYLRHGAQATTPRTARLPDQTGYVVVYLYQAQGTVFPPFDQFYPHATPSHTVTIHGVDYAWIYQVPPPVDHPQAARFGSTIQLRGYAIEGIEGMEGIEGIEGMVPRGHPLVFKLFWQTRSTPPTETWLFAHLVGMDGHHYGRLDIPYDTATWGANRFRTTELPIPIPSDLPGGTYRLVIGLYDPSNGQRLPLTTTPPPDPAIDGPDALLLTEVVVKEVE